MAQAVAVPPPMLVWSVKFVVSTTSVVPSQWPRESPRYCRISRAHAAAVGVDDARVVHHLVADGDHARRLDDAVAVAVDDRHDRADDAARHAAIVEREVELVVEGALAEAATIARRGAGQRLLGKRGRMAVLGFDHDGSLAVGPRLPRAVVSERAHGVDAGVAALGVGLGGFRELLVAQDGAVPELSGRSRGMPSAASLVQTPWRSGSPHGVLVAFAPSAGLGTRA